MADTNYVGASDFLGIPSSFDDDPRGYRPLIGYGNRGFVEAGMHGRRGAPGVDPNYGLEPIYGEPRYTEESAMKIYSMSEGQVFKWQRMLAAAGMLSTFAPGRADSTYNAYKAAMTEANREGITLKDYLGQRAAAIQRGTPGGGGGGGGSSSSSSSFSSTSSSSSSMTSESVSLTGRGQAESLLRQAMTQQLGRAPTNKEVAKFKRALNTQEKKNPTITKSTSNSTTTTTGSSKGTHQTSSSTTTGTQKSTTKQSDIDAGEEALDFARSKPFKSERKMYQDMQYYDAIAEMIGL